MTCQFVDPARPPYGDASCADSRASAKDLSTRRVRTICIKRTYLFRFLALQGFFPRFHVVHTSRKILGQVYIPLVNYTLMTLTLIVVGTFEKSSKLGQAYGKHSIALYVWHRQW